MTLRFVDCVAHLSEWERERARGDSRLVNFHCVSAVIVALHLILNLLIARELHPIGITF